MANSYPTRNEIEALFKNMETGDHAEVFKRVSPNVDWTVMGTHPCAGKYTRYATPRFLGGLHGIDSLAASRSFKKRRSQDWERS